METPQSLWPFTERSGVNVSQDLGLLLAEVDTDIPDVEKQLLQAYGEGLITGQLSEDARVVVEGQKGLTLPEIERMPVITSEAAIYTDYFSAGTAATAQADLEKIGLPGHSKEDLRAAIYGPVARGDSDAKKLIRPIATRSENWFKNAIVENLGTADSSSETLELTGDVLHVNFAPDQLLDKARQMQGYRRFYRQAYRELRDTREAEPSSDTLENAQDALLEISIARINHMMALLYPHILHLADQLSQSPVTELTTKWKQDLLEITPAIKGAFGEDKAKKDMLVANLVRRLDLLRNGAGEEYDSEGNLTPISRKAVALAEVIEGTSPDETGPQISPEWTIAETLELQRTSWKADQTGRLAEFVLTEWEMMSEHQSTWEEFQKRKGTAPDNKWQIVYKPDASSIDTIFKKKALVIGEDFERGLVQQSPAGVLPVLAHELAHTLQAEAKEALGAELPLAQIGGRRARVMWELGGILEEREAFEKLGMNRPTNTTYLRALQAKLAGGSEEEVAQAFFEAKMRSPDADITKARTAAKSVIRLYRHGGYNSEPLDYLEQGLLLEEMNANLPADTIRTLALGASAFSLPDAARLREAGLLPLPSAARHNPAEDVLRVYRQHYLDKK